MLKLPFKLNNIEKAYDNTENGTRGYYPMGAGNFWHGGIHLNSGSLDVMEPLVPGKVVAYRLRKEYKKIEREAELVKSEYERIDRKDLYVRNLSSIGITYKLRTDISEADKKKEISDCFILFKHELPIKQLASEKLIFYTLYMNLCAADEGKELYDRQFTIDGKVHIAEKPFSAKAIGSAGKDNGERYIDIAVMTEKKLFDYTAKQGLKEEEKKKIFNAIGEEIALYKGTQKESKKKKYYVTAGSRFEVKESAEQRGKEAVKVTLVSAAVFVPTKSMGETFAVGQIQKLENVNFIMLNDLAHKIDFAGSCVSNENCRYLYEYLTKNKYQTKYKNRMCEIIGKAGANPKIEIIFTQLNKAEKIEFWVIKDSFMDMENGEIVENKEIEVYEENPFIYEFEQARIGKEERERISGYESGIYKNAKGEKYYKIQEKPLYVKEQDKAKTLKAAFEWEHWFTDTEGKTGESKGILCDRTEVLKNTKAKAEIEELLGGETRLGSRKFRHLYGKEEQFEYAGKIRRETRKLACTHPIEWDKKLFDKIKEDYDKCVFTGHQTVIQETNLKHSAEALDIWEGGLEKIFAKNELHFVHPIYFLNHLDRAGVFEFNPYLGKTYKEIYKNTVLPSEINGSAKVIHNPGFAPVWREGKWNDENPNCDGYACITGFFNEDYLNVKRSNGKTYKEDGFIQFTHEGVDFRGEEGTEIHSLIYGTILAYGEFETYGNTIFVAAKNGKGIYLLAHLKKYNKSVVDKKDISPGDIVGYVGKTGGDYDPHLHVTYFDYEYIAGKKLVSGNGGDITSTSLFDKVYNENRANPFKYSELKMKNIKKVVQ